MKTGGTAVERNRRRVFLAILTIVASMFAFGEVRVAQASTSALVKNVVLVHGGFVDGSGWKGVYSALKRDGYTVSIVQCPTTSLADDVAVTKRAIEAQNGPVILVGHSYGGAVITEAGNNPKVAGLVYIAAFAPDKGESVSTLIKDPPPGAPVPPILPPQEGFLFLDKAKFAASFAADVKADEAAFMADSQVPWGVDALGGTITEPAWRAKPSWYLVTTDDRMIPPAAQRAMSSRAGATVVEVKGSHAVYVSQPRAVASLIEKAAKGSLTAARWEARQVARARFRAPALRDVFQGQARLLEGRHTALLSCPRRAPDAAGGADDHACRREDGQGVCRAAQRDEESRRARRAGSAETARTRDVLHAMVELYYDRFAAAVDVANSATVSGARGFPACEWCCVNRQRAGEHDFGRESYLESPDIAYHHTAVWRGRESIPSSRRLLFAR